MQPVAMASSPSIIVRSIGLVGSLSESSIIWFQLSWGFLRLQSAFRTRSLSLSTYLVPEAQSWQLSCVFLGGFPKFNLSFPKWVDRKGFRLGYTSEHVQLSPGGYPSGCARPCHFVALAARSFRKQSFRKPCLPTFLHFDAPLGHLAGVIVSHSDLVHFMVWSLVPGSLASGSMAFVAVES
ncbi:hypothetical protein C8R46DRAFT_1127997 [Mycena filopes]|nr:hypothetical protein C8R46DRAFT_1127997 [Mycena filopes]